MRSLTSRGSFFARSRCRALSGHSTSQPTASTAASWISASCSLSATHSTRSRGISVRVLRSPVGPGSRRWVPLCACSLYCWHSACSSGRPAAHCCSACSGFSSSVFSWASSGRSASAGEGYANRVLRTAGEQTVQIQRTAGFRTGTGQPFAAERLNADHRANHIAVDVQVAHLGAAGDLGDGFVDTGMHAEGQAVARGVNLLDQFVQLVTVIAHHVQYRAEDLFFSSSKLSSSISVGGTKVP